MAERDDLIKKVTADAEKEAKKQKLNEAQAKLFIEEEVKKALAEYDAKQEENKIPVVQPSVPTSEEPKKENKQEAKKSDQAQKKEIRQLETIVEKLQGFNSHMEKQK